MAIPILWRDSSRICSREQQQNRAPGSCASLSLPIRDPQSAYSLLLLSAACAKRASFRGPSLPSTLGCLAYFNSIPRVTSNENLHPRMATLNYSVALKYFLGGNMPPLISSLPPRRRICSVQFTQPCLLNPRKCRAVSYDPKPTSYKPNSTPPNAPTRPT